VQLVTFAKRAKVIFGYDESTNTASDIDLIDYH